MPEIQTTFQNIPEIKKVKALTERQRQVLTLLSKGFWQSDIAERLKISQPRINQIVKALESKGLVKKKIESDIKGPREYRNYYEVSPEAKLPGADFNICHVHRIRMKFRILSQSGPVSLDKRTGYQKSHPMRGWTSHKFWYPGKNTLPSVTIDLNPKNLVVYMDKGQMINAKDMDQAEEIAWYAVYQARDQFVHLQEKYGTRFEIETTGTRIDKVEYGFLYHKDSGVGEAVKPLPPNWWDDASVEQEFPDHREFETNVKPEAQQVQSAITQLKAMPEFLQNFEKKFGEVNDNVLAVAATLQGGRPVESMMLNMLDLMSRMTARINTLESELSGRKPVATPAPVEESGGCFEWRGGKLRP
jgi:DNA-binding transcriptional ArsR family regulator